jgi:hypothetical protein
MIRSLPRLTLHEQLSRKPEYRGRELAINVTTPGGKTLRATEVVARLQAGGLNALQWAMAEVEVLKRAPEMQLSDLGDLLSEGTVLLKGTRQVREILIQALGTNGFIARENNGFVVKVMPVDLKKVIAALNEATGLSLRLPTPAEGQVLAEKDRDSLEGQKIKYFVTDQSRESGMAIFYKGLRKHTIIGVPELRIKNEWVLMQVYDDWASDRCGVVLVEEGGSSSRPPIY